MWEDEIRAKLRRAWSSANSYERFSPFVGFYPVICDDQDPFFRNERIIQGGVPLDQFLTRKLWDVGSSAPYGHRGDLTTITEAILHHAGEAHAQRERFASLGKEQQAEIIEFLKQLQVLPNGSPREVTEEELRLLWRSQRSVRAAEVLNR